MTVKELIEKLKKLPEDHEVVIHEAGALWDSKVKSVYIHPYNRDHGQKIVTIKGA